MVLMDDDPLKVVKAVRIAKKCMRIVYQNIYFAIGIKILCLLLGAVGIANMWIAIFADVGVMVIAVLNAIRALFVKKIIIPVQKIPACDMIKRKGREITWQKQKRVCAVIQRKFMRSF